MSDRTTPTIPQGFVARGAGLQRGLIALALGGLAAGALTGSSPGEGGRLAFAYFASLCFYISLALGGLFLVMLFHITHARWAVGVRRLCEALAMTLPLMAILFLPVFPWLDTLYVWARPEAVAADPLLPHKTVYMNPVFYCARAIGFLLLWWWLAARLYRCSRIQDRPGRPELSESMRRLSAPGLLALSITVTFAAFDWLMSLDSHWYSTIFGVYFFSGAMVGGLAALALLTIASEATGAAGGFLNVEHRHDIGKLLLAFVIFWAYIAFSQLLLIWMGNLPEETEWYLNRWRSGGWRSVGYFLILGNFVFPLLFLLPRAVKRNRVTLALVAAWLLPMHYVDIYWLVMPAHDCRVVGVRAYDLFILFGMGCLFAGRVVGVLRRGPLAPIGDARLAESLQYENQ